MKFLIQIRTIIEESALKQEDFVNKVVKLVKNKSSMIKESKRSLPDGTYVMIQSDGLFIGYDYKEKEIEIGKTTHEGSDGVMDFLVTEVECEDAIKFLAAFQHDNSWVAPPRPFKERVELMAELFYGIGKVHVWYQQGWKPVS